MLGKAIGVCQRCQVETPIRIIAFRFSNTQCEVDLVDYKSTKRAVLLHRNRRTFWGDPSLVNVDWSFIDKRYGISISCTTKSIDHGPMKRSH